MTACVYIQWDNVPVLVADVALTGGRPLEPDPKLNDRFGEQMIAAFKGEGNPLNCYCRKIVDVDQNTTYCWSGRLIEAVAFHENLVEFIQHGDVTRESLSEFFEKYPREDAKELEVILLSNSGGAFRPYFLNTAEFVDDGGTSIAIIGSGTEDVYKILQQTEGMFNQPYSDSLLAILLSSIFHHSTMTEVGAKNAWGGGLESRRLQNGILERFHNISFIFLQLLVGKNGRKQHTVINDYHHEYVGDNCIFFRGGSPAIALPHYQKELILEDMNSDLHPDMLVVGYQIENDPKQYYFYEDASRLPPPGLLELEHNRAVVRYSSEVYDGIFAKFRATHPGPVEKYLRKKQPTKPPNLMRPAHLAP